MPSTAPPGIGTKLRRARIERSLSIEETAWRTRIRPELLRALELEEFAAIGHQSFVRSHLSSYARFLGMDPSEVVEQFETQQDPLPSSIEELDRQVRVAKKPPRPKWLIAAAVSGSVLIAAAVVGMLGGQAERPTANLSPVVPPIPASASPAQVPAAEARVRFRVEATAETNVSIQVDGVQVFDGAIEAGGSKSVRAREVVEILAADAGTISLRLNGEDLGVAGEKGELYRARFGPRGRLRD